MPLLEAKSCQQTLLSNFWKNYFVVVACLYQNKWPGVQFYTPSPQKDPKNPNQKLGRCYMKAPIRQALLKASLFIVHFSKRYLKTSWSIFFMKNQLQTDVFVAFVKPLSSVLLTSSLSTTTWLKSLEQGFRLTLLLCSIGSQNGNLQWFSVIQSCYSRGTLNLTENSFRLEQAVLSI